MVRKMKDTSWNIGSVKLANHIIVGPLAGISNRSFRLIARRFEAGLVYTEMTSDKGLWYGSKKTAAMTVIQDDERPVSLQLFGRNADTLTAAAKYVDAESGCDIIDINMGCPVPKVVKSNGGSALMLQPEYAYELIRAVVAAVTKPVTVKIRSGWDQQHINAVEVARLMEKAGVSAIAVHPRTRAQFYSGQADWDLIRQVKQAVSIPVIGNGDINSVADMIAMKEQTGCDAFMVARGCLGNPWLIRQLVTYEQQGIILEAPSVDQRFDQALQHAGELISLKGEINGIKEMRGHACWYLAGLPKSNRVKAKFNDMTTYQQFETILQQYRQAMATNDYSWFEKTDC